MAMSYVYASTYEVATYSAEGNRASEYEGKKRKKDRQTDRKDNLL